MWNSIGRPQKKRGWPLCVSYQQPLVSAVNSHCRGSGHGGVSFNSGSSVLHVICRLSESIASSYDMGSPSAHQVNKSSRVYSHNYNTCPFLAAKRVSSHQKLTLVLITSSRLECWFGSFVIKKFRRNVTPKWQAAPFQVLVAVVGGSRHGLL